MYSALFSLMLACLVSAQPNAIVMLKQKCDTLKIRCICGPTEKPFILPVELQEHLLGYDENGAAKCSYLPDPLEVCSSHSCSLMPEETKLGDKAAGPVLNALLSSFLPQVFELPPSDDVRERRVERDLDACKVTPLKNAEVKCWKWPNWINCDITCIHGHGIQLRNKVASKTTVNCRLTENHWKPALFQDCQPFLNCRVKLVKPGDLTCKGPGNGAAYCDISCMDYDDLPAVDMKRYECNNEGYAQTLPHCAILDNKSVQLIPKPSE